jgi:translation initiation factor IF-3
LSRPFPSRTSPFASSFARVNGKIRAREVRVIGVNGQQLGVFSLADAITMARSHGVDLVEIAATANPPVCRLVDYGKFRYEQAKKEKEAKKHQHANKVKEIQLSANIDPHDFTVKLGRAIDFLCEEMKVKISLKFRGREMAHQEYGFQIVQRFISEVAPYGHPDAPPKLIGKGISTMLSPLPRNKRAKNPRVPEPEGLAEGNEPAKDFDEDQRSPDANNQPVMVDQIKEQSARAATNTAEEKPGEFGNNAFASLDAKLGKLSP